MKCSNKYWFDVASNNRALELHLRWDRFILHGNDCSGRVVDRNSRSLCVEPTYLAVVKDSVGLGVETLPKSFELWYNSKYKRLCISLWVICFWFDFSRRPFFRKLLKSNV